MIEKILAVAFIYMSCGVGTVGFVMALLAIREEFFAPPEEEE